MKFEHTQVWGFEHALRGMRNPKESHHLSDSCYGLGNINDCTKDWDIADKYANKYGIDIFSKEGKKIDDWLCNNGVLQCDGYYLEYAFIGPEDMRLAQTLIKAGSEHRKFLRQIKVSVDITAPLFFWKELDTYQVGVTKNSESTMHKLATTPITVEHFENIFGIFEKYSKEEEEAHRNKVLEIINYCEELRQKFIQTDDKRYWDELIRILPDSWLQKRTVTLNYENLLGICSKGQRRNHKLNEWSGKDVPALDNFIQWVREEIPYAQQFIFIDEEHSDPYKIFMDNL